MNRLNIKQVIATSLLFISVLFAGLTQAGQSYYKWVDDRGVTHYGSQPPAQYADIATKIKVNSTTPSGHKAAQTKLEDRSKRLADQSKKASENTTPVEEQASKEEEEIRNKNCETYKRNLTIMNQSARIREKNTDGEMVMLSEDIKQERMKAAKDFIAEFCK